MGIKLNRILLIDDDDISNFLHRKLLMRSGIAKNIETVETVKDGLDLLCHHESDGQPELIFLDLNLPGLSGWDFINEYKTIKEKNGIKSKIVLLTASANPEDEQKAREIKEIVEYLTKPLTDSNVKAIVDKYFAPNPF